MDEQVSLAAYRPSTLVPEQALLGSSALADNVYELGGISEVIQNGSPGLS